MSVLHDLESFTAQHRFALEILGIIVAVIVIAVSLVAIARYTISTMKEYKARARREKLRNMPSLKVKPEAAKNAWVLDPELGLLPCAPLKSPSQVTFDYTIPLVGAADSVSSASSIKSNSSDTTKTWLPPLAGDLSRYAPSSSSPSSPRCQPYSAGYLQKDFNPLAAMSSESVLYFPTPPSTPPIGPPPRSIPLIWRAASDAPARKKERRLSRQHRAKRTTATYLEAPTVNRPLTGY